MECPTPGEKAEHYRNAFTHFLWLYLQIIIAITSQYSVNSCMKTKHENVPGKIFPKGLYSPQLALWPSTNFSGVNVKPQQFAKTTI